MKKILSIVLCAVLALTLVVGGVTAFAAENPSISITADKTNVAIGDTVTYTVTLDGASNVSGGVRCFEFKISLPTGLTYVSSSIDSNFTTNTGWTMNSIGEIDAQTLKFAGTGTSTTTYSGESLPVMTIVCTVNNQVTYNSALTVSINSVKLYDVNLTRVDCVAGSVSVTPKQMFTVTFKDWDGTTLKTESVMDGNAATAPADPTRNWYTFKGWDVEFDNVTSDTVVTALYSVGIGGQCGDALTWLLVEDGTLTISGTGAMWVEDAMDYPWDDYCDDVTSIVIEEGVTAISSDAFCACCYAETVSLPNTLTSIGEYAFQSNEAMTSINIPDSVTSMGMGVFEWCTALETVDYSAGMTEIPDWLFNGCESMTEFTIGENIVTIGECAFAWSGITEVTVPATVQEVRDGAFEGAEYLETVYWYAAEADVGAGVFADIADESVIYTVDKSLFIDTEVDEDNGNYSSELTDLLGIYTVTFKDWDGTILGTETVFEGEDANAPTDPTREHYTFTGWSVDYTNVTANLEAVAQYSANQQTVTYQYTNAAPAGASAVPAASNCGYGTTVTVASMPTVPAGWVFTGWSTTDVTVTDGSFTMPATAVTFTGTWVQLGSLTADDVVDIADVAFVYNAVLTNTTTSFTAIQTLAADVDRSTTVDINDVSALLEAVVTEDFSGLGGNN